MRSEWTVSTFAELIEQGVLEVGDGYRAKNDELGGDGLMFLRAGHVTDTHIDFTGVERFRDMAHEKFGSKIARPGDVVITTKGNSTGRVTYVTKEMPSFVYSPHLSYWRSRSFSVLHPEFLRAWSRCDEFTTQLDAMSRSTDMAPYLSLSDQRRLRITLPPFEVQAGIGELGAAIEARIDLIRQTNATLESIAQALFKSWFIDFDPVRAKAEGSEPEGMDAATAALFPDSFNESELGLLPRGWRTAPLGDLVTTLGGGTPDTKESSYWAPADYCWTTPKDLSGIQSSVLLETERKLSAKGVAKISSGLLPIGTLLMSSRAPIGYLAITQMPMAINQGYIAMPPGSILPPLYMLFWCQRNMEMIKSHANGSTFMEISKRSFRPLPVLVPPSGLLDAFVAVAESIFGRIVENERQGRTLVALRDILLPRLISGQLRLPDAGSVIEEVVA